MASTTKPTEPQDILAATATAIGKDLDLAKARYENVVDVLGKIVKTAKEGGFNPHDKYFMEKMIQFVASLPNTSIVRDELTAKLVSMLWSQLQHPPTMYLGEGPPLPAITIQSPAELKYRAADGSNNNPKLPELGASGHYYAKSVKPVWPKLPADKLPTPAAIFDKLLLRSQDPKPHPNGISNILFYLATIIIHDIFNTNPADPKRSKSSSYLDLAPLYGHNQKEQDSVRLFKDGLLKPDTFAEYRLIGQPPGVCAFIIAFNRFHNYVVKELATRNEDNRFGVPAGLTGPDLEKALRTRDNDLFQTGRLIVGGLYVNIIMNDYIRAILNLNQNPNFGSDWNLDPRKTWDHLAVPIKFPHAGGNQVSLEFSMIYRWHATINTANEKWAQGFFKHMFGPDMDPNTIKTTDFTAGARKWAMGLPTEPSQRVFGGLARKPEGGFKDGDLIELLSVATQFPAAQYGAQSTPLVMKPIEMLGIENGRLWNTATLNEVRTFFKMPAHKTFEEMNPDPKVVKALKELYPTVNDVELYAGIQAEEAKIPFFPGSGLCPGFTISQAILSDAVGLVRGDRFYTDDYTPERLTKWGFEFAGSSRDHAQGGVMYKLFQTAFPGWFKDNSVWSLYPLTTPDKNKEIFSKLGMAGNFSYDAPSAPK